MQLDFQDWDLSLLMAVRSYHSQIAVWTAWVFASLAWKGVSSWIMALIFWIRGHRRLATQFVLALGTGTLAIVGLKGLILRPRPDLFAARELNIPMPELLPTQHSFPSGHTLLAAAIMMVLLSRYRDWRAVAAVAFVFLVGWARVYQGMHWPSDIVGSVILGVVAGILAVKISDLPIVRKRTEDRVSEPNTARFSVESGQEKETAGVR